MTSQTLSARAALKIATQHGFSIRDGKWERSFIRDSIIQAREAEMCPHSDGRRKTAEQYFDGYMAGTASDIRAEGLRARDFERNAY